jgi:hypothetical protein
MSEEQQDQNHQSLPKKQLNKETLEEKKNSAIQEILSNLRLGLAVRKIYEFARCKNK